METLEKSQVCRLCGKQAGISFDIFDKNENYAKKINAVLPILVHEMDLLPKQMCYCCNCKLKEFHKFYEDCLKTDSELKSQLSWMQNSEEQGEINDPMVLITNTVIKTEPFVYDEKEFTSISSDNEKSSNIQRNDCANNLERTIPDSVVRCTSCGCNCGNANEISENIEQKYSQTEEITCDDGSTKANYEFENRDSIKRNLFATQMFADKKLRVQTEIPICSIPIELMDHEVLIEGVNSNTNLERIDTDNEVESMKKNEIKKDEKNAKVSGTLRPRKRFTHNSSLLCKTLSESSNEINGESYRNNTTISDTDSDVTSLRFTKRKYVTSEEIDRTLRPRTAEINYSELRKLRACSRTTAFLPRPKNNEQDQKSSDSHDDFINSRDFGGLFRKLAMKRKRSNEIFDTPIDVVNFDENDTLSVPNDELKSEESIKYKNNDENNQAKRKKSTDDNVTLVCTKKELNTCTSVKKKKKLSAFDIENFVKKMKKYKEKKRNRIAADQQKCEKSYIHPVTGRKCLVEITKNNMASDKKSKKSGKSCSRSSRYYKTKSNYRRIAYPKKYQVQGPKERKRKKNESENSPSEFARRKMLHAQRRYKRLRRTQRKFKCPNCNVTFVSNEVYKLHSCYNFP